MAAFRKAGEVKKGTRRKPGLWFSKMKVEVQTITKRQRLPCFVCGVIPQERRLFVHRGAGRHGWTEVYCIECGVQWFKNKEMEAKRGMYYLLDGTSSIRFTPTFLDSKGNPYPDPYAAFKAKLRAKAKAKANNDEAYSG